MNKLHVLLLPLSIAFLLMLFTPLGQIDKLNYLFIIVGILLLGASLYIWSTEKEKESQRIIKLLSTINESQYDDDNILRKIAEFKTEISEELENHKKTNTELNQIKISKIEEILKMRESFEDYFSDSKDNIYEICNNSNEIVTFVNNIQDEIKEIHSNFEEILKFPDNMLEHTDEIKESLRDFPEKLQENMETLNSNHLTGLQKQLDVFVDVSTIIKEQIDINQKINESFVNYSEELIKTISESQDLNDHINENNQQSQKTNGQLLVEIKNMQESLIKAISELADSKSKERQYLLKIQSNLLDKYGNLKS